MESKGEKQIAKILRNTGIRFEREKIFSDIRNKYRFDFYIPSLKVCLEYNGQQHYEFTSHFYKNRSEFTKAKERDRRKVSYCLSHQIKLYCIPYWELNNLHTFEDLTQEKFHAHTKFHNDEAYRNQKNEI